MSPDAKKAEDQDSSLDLELDASEDHPNEVSEEAPSSSVGADDTGLLSVVRDVVDQQVKAGDTTASPTESEDAKNDGGSDQVEEDNENFSDVPFHKHPRFQQLLGRSKANQQDADRYRNVQTFIDKQGLSAEEAAEGLVIAGLVKTNPVGAWERLKPVVQALLVAAGEVVPKDLQDRVQAGEISEQAALELSRERARAKGQQAHHSFEKKKAQREQQISNAQALVEEANRWQSERRQRDPNFASKEDALVKEVLFIQHAEGKASTPAMVREQLDRAYKSVKPPASRQPAPVRKAASVSTSGQVAGNHKPQQRSTLDIINSVVEGSG